MEQIRSRLARVHLDFLKTDPDLFSDHLRAVDIRDAAVVAEMIEEWQIGNRLAIRKATPLEVRDPLGTQAPPELVHQPGLSHANLSDKRHSLAVSGFHLPEQLVQGSKLSISAYKAAQASRA
jgi:hypothetical protein